MNIKRIIREELLREANQQSQGYTVQQLQQAMNAGNYQQAYQMLNSVTARTMKERYALQNIGNKLTQMYRSGQMNQQQPAQQNMTNTFVNTMQNELTNGIQQPQAQQVQMQVPQQPIQAQGFGQPMQGNVSVMPTVY